MKEGRRRGEGKERMEIVLYYSGSWKIFSGNEMGTLITWWVWKNWREANPTADTSNIYILNSAVSSQIVKTMAEVEGG